MPIRYYQILRSGGFGYFIEVEIGVKNEVTHKGIGSPSLDVFGSIEGIEEIAFSFFVDQRDPERLLTRNNAAVQCDVSLTFLRLRTGQVIIQIKYSEGFDIRHEQEVAYSTCNLIEEQPTSEA